MICELVRQGKKVGITAISHKVIQNLLLEVIKAANEAGLKGLNCIQKVNEKPDAAPPGITLATDNAEPLAALRRGVQVVGGTAWLWSREEYFEAVDVLFVDEAGQMSLANVLAVSQGAKNLVLLGDPQQLEQPLKGSHPDGAAVSALEHLLGGAKTISPDMGLFLEKTWRLHPKLCDFTSEVFYEGRLHPREGLENQKIEGHPWLGGSGLWFRSSPSRGQSELFCGRGRVYCRSCCQSCANRCELDRRQGAKPSAAVGRRAHCRPIQCTGLRPVESYSEQRESARWISFRASRHRWSFTL